ncbi:MAG: hypothetical protein JXA75_01325 [Candidatus Thermoplasmatota archaeon]|nr:hypothetical protein [Candidatus Thermoplasmatota archaeon]
MVNKKQTFVLTTALLILCIGTLVGCTTPENGSPNENGTNSENEPFVGQWQDKDSGEVLIFSSDGNLTESVSVSTYRVEGTFIYFNENDPDLKKTAKFYFEEDDVLILTFLSPEYVEGIVMTLLKKTEG